MLHCVLDMHKEHEGHSVWVLKRDISMRWRA